MKMLRKCENSKIREEVRKEYGRSSENIKYTERLHSKPKSVLKKDATHPVRFRWPLADEALAVRSPVLGDSDRCEKRCVRNSKHQSYLLPVNVLPPLNTVFSLPLKQIKPPEIDEKMLLLPVKLAV